VQTVLNTNKPDKNVQSGLVQGAVCWRT